MTITVNYTNGDASKQYPTIQAAATALLKEFPQGVIYDAGGGDQDEDSSDAAYDVRDGRAALAWDSEAASINDDGAKAVASINVEDAE